MYFTPPAMMLAFLLSRQMRELTMNEIDVVAGGPVPVIVVVALIGAAATLGAAAMAWWNSPPTATASATAADGSKIECTAK